MPFFKTTFMAAAVAAALLAASVSAVAQTSDAKKPTAVKKADKPAAKSDTKPAAKKQPKVNPNSRTDLKSSAKNVAAGVSAADAALTPDEIAIAERVYHGRLPCELGAYVTLTPDAKFPGYFDVQGNNFKYRMFPVTTTTGTVRLEDKKAGAVWLQMGNKSMLMNQKSGTRIADECMSPAQVAVAEAIKLNPPVSVLDSAPKSSSPTAK